MSVVRSSHIAHSVKSDFAPFNLHEVSLEFFSKKVLAFPMGQTQPGRSLTSRTLLQAALQALESVLAEPVMKPFISRVTERIAPGYREVIKHPMDLTTVCSKLENSGGYDSAEEAKADISLVRLSTYKSES